MNPEKLRALLVICLFAFVGFAPATSALGDGGGERDGEHDGDHDGDHDHDHDWGHRDEEYSPGLRAYWSLGVSHADKLGHVDWTQHDLTTIVDDVNFPLTSGAFVAEGPTDYFALRLIGKIEMPQTGLWTFSLSSDEAARLWIDGELVVNDGTRHGFHERSGQITLDAGRHDIEIHFLERYYSAGLELRWTGPDTDKEIVPAEAFTYPATEPEFDSGDGLWVYWSHNLSHADNLGHVDWSNYDRAEVVPKVSYRITNGAFELGGPDNYFAGRFMGLVDIPESGSWGFELGSDEAAALIIDGNTIIADDVRHGFRWKTGSVDLEAGEHQVEVRYYERYYSAGLVLVWQGPSDDYASVIPSTAFTPGVGMTGSSTGGLHAYWSLNQTQADTVAQIDWTQHDRMTTETNIAYELTDGSFITDGPDNYFAARFVALLDVPVSGSWRFGLGSDESARLYIDGQPLIVDDSRHGFRWQYATVTLGAGEHDFEVRYYERYYSAGLVVTWEGPAHAYQEVIPSSAFSTYATDPAVEGSGGDGLRAYWYEGMTQADHVGHIDWADYDNTSMVDNISWSSTNGSFADGEPENYFGLRLVGLLDTPTAGAYRFGLGSDESAQLYIDGQLLVDDSTRHGFRWKYGDLDLEAGEHQIEVRYYERYYSAGLVLTWDTPDGYEEVIPPAAFSHAAEETPFDPGGGGLRAYWSTDQTQADKVGHVDWESHDQATIVDNVSWKPTDGEFYEGGPENYFALRLVGRVDIPASGSWTFGVGSDESAVLFIDGEPVVVDDVRHGLRWRYGTVSLDAGEHDIEMWYYERYYSASLYLSWKGPTVPAEIIIPASAFSLPESDTPFEPGGGIRAYWSSNLSHADNAGQIDWAASDTSTDVTKVHFSPTNGAFYTDGPDNYFSGRFVGLLDVPETGEWSFELGSDEAAMLYIDDELVVDDHIRHGFRWKTGSVSLTEGEHKVEVRYFERYYSAALSLVWQGPSMPFALVIPASAYSIDPEPTPVDPGGAALRAEWVWPVQDLDSIETVDFSDPTAVTTELRPYWRSTNNAFFAGGPTNYFALRLTGTLQVPEAGEWTFNVGSDEVAALFIDGEPVARDTTRHGFRWSAGSVSLGEGAHEFEVLYGERYYSAGLVVTWRGPSDPLESVIPASAFEGSTGPARRVIQWTEVSPSDN
ncbi:MAG: hypothetical protein H6810_07930 [Phycisphaeraceae bacterium]|nr:MAG: hypothetical protein H6810_07930 [Phycisphaeraceae bacterium]